MRLSLPFAAAIVLLAVALAGCSAPPRTVSYSADGTPPHVVPAVSDGAHKFYSQGQVDAAWREVTWDYPQALPPGVNFPLTAPPYFHPNDGTKDIYETGLPQQFAAQYWQCAWLSVSISARKKGESATLASTDSKLSLYAGLPGMREVKDLKSDQMALAAAASAAHMPVESYEYLANCGFFKNYSSKP